MTGLKMLQEGNQKIVKNNPFISRRSIFKMPYFILKWYNDRIKERKMKWNKKRNSLTFHGFLNGF